MCQPSLHVLSISYAFFRFPASIGSVWSCRRTIMRKTSKSRNVSDCFTSSSAAAGRLADYKGESRSLGEWELLSVVIAWIRMKSLLSSGRYLQPDIRRGRLLCRGELRRPRNAWSERRPVQFVCFQQRQGQGNLILKPLWRHWRDDLCRDGRNMSKLVARAAQLVKVYDDANLTLDCRLVLLLRGPSIKLKFTANPKWL